MSDPKIQKEPELVPNRRKSIPSMSTKCPPLQP